MMETSYSSRIFRGIRFVLRGFNPVAESQIRFKLVNGGGVDVGQYGGSCSHVIVHNIAYDDPVCVAARNDRKTLVTALWVDHSADVGMPVDATSVMYRPLKDLDGIPGAKDLIMCLTGYLRQDREDIMTMVGLMGAQFSKPLVANKVTHLLCYKFEGEKYELAKKLGTIKLVNHRWLEDCLKEWTLLPEDKYNKSGFELEMMEEEAKDSEEEAEDSKLGQSGGRNTKQSPLSSKFGVAATHGLLKSVTEASNALPDSTVPQVLPNVNNGEDSLTIPRNKRPDQDSSFHNVDDSKVSYQAPDVSRQSTLCQLPDELVKTSESKNVDSLSPKALGCQNLDNTRSNISSGQQPDLHNDTSKSKKLVSDSRATSASVAGVAHSNEKLRTASYSRKNQKRFTLPRILDESSGREGNSCDNSKVKQGSEGVKSTSIEVSGKGNSFINENEPISLLPQKRINEASSTKLKSRKKTSVPSANGKSQGLKVTSQVDEPPEADEYFSISRDDINISNTSSKPSGSTSNSLAFDEPFLRNAGPESAQCANVCQHSPKVALQNLSESEINSKPDITGSGMQQVDGNETEQHNVTKNLDCSYLGNRKSCNVESSGCTNLDLGAEESNKVVRKSPKKKATPKKSLGSKPKVGATAKQKKSLSLNKTTLQGEGVTVSSGSKEIATSDAKMHQGWPQILDDNKTTELETFSKNAEDAGDRTEFLDDETEAPDDKFEHELGMALDEDLVHLSKKPDTAKEDTSETIFPATNCEEVVPPKKGTNKTEKQKTSSPVVKHQARKSPAGKVKATIIKYAQNVGDATELLDDETEAPDDKCKLGMALDEESVHLSIKSDTVTEEKWDCPATKCEDAMAPKKGTEKTEKLKPSSVVAKNQTRKRPAGKAKATVANKFSRSKMAVSGEKIANETGHELEIETVEDVSFPADKSDNSAVPSNKSENLAEEKENRPVDVEQDQVKSRSDGDPTIKSSVRPAKNKSAKSGLNPSISKSNTRVKAEAVCFILSGHRLQRKEFQLVIKRLKGRVCRDSHQWSYQATHFISPDPIRRTEKFFAAAASGRWILKTDFLTASSQEGKFLPEEPYEWHKNGLSEDGAINMEAPRKWRLLKERTGHGAFYGMRIVVYGDCIAPPLDTLKRVIKAGDGTILATSPPYSRFLGTEIDYAVVSPGIPRVDMWVQEFLKHEIPCVVADYLVEYVCKPGFSLERHVLYGTHPWAERSFGKLKSKEEEIVEELVAPKDSSDDDDDIICQVCGSRDRGDVMLICGDEGGSVGCGIGTHIDCCDPPLTGVPQEDWFCPKCNISSTRNCSNNPSKRKRTVLSSSECMLPLLSQ